MVTTKSTRVQAPDFLSYRGAPARRALMKPTSSSSTHSGDGAVLKKAITPVDTNHPMKLGTWNVLSLAQEGYVDLVSEQLAKYNVSVAGLTETRLTGQGELDGTGYKLLYSGGNSKIHGVALMLRHPANKAIISWGAVSPRLLTARIRHRLGAMSIIVAYAPTDVSETEEKDKFYEQLHNAVSVVTPHDQLFILGDLNATTGTDSDIFPSVVGQYGSGTVNDNSFRMLSFCTSHGLHAVGSWFRRKNIHRWTWISNDHRTVKEIDHILSSTRSVFKSYRVYRGAEAPANTDHRLLVASVSLRSLPRPKLKRPPRIAVENLSCPAIASSYCDHLRTKLRSVCESSSDVEGLWSNVSREILHCASESIGFTTLKKQQPWVTADILATVEQKAVARLSGDVAERRRLCGLLRGKLKAARENYYNRLADEAEACMHSNNLRTAYRVINTIGGRKERKQPSAVLKADGQPCKTDEELLARWSEHYKTMLNHAPGIPHPDLHDLSTIDTVDSFEVDSFVEPPILHPFDYVPLETDEEPPLLEVVTTPSSPTLTSGSDDPPDLVAINLDPPILEKICDMPSAAFRTNPKPPTIEEIIAAIKKLKNGRAAGPDDIPAELLKYAAVPVAHALHRLFEEIWCTGTVPAAWREGVIISLYKGKGSKTDCSSYRPITLLSVPGKVFAHVLLARIKPLLTTLRRPQQSGFTSGRGTADAALALRLLSEIHREYNRPLDVIYIDLKAAFDSVDRTVLWSSLQAVGIPPPILALLRDLHTGTSSSVRLGSKLSPAIVTTSGVRQGCVLAPDLFCHVVDRIMDRVSADVGVEVGNVKFTDLDYADDGALLLPNRINTATILQSFDSLAANFGLRVSWAKTKLQNLGAGLPPASVEVGGNVVETVNEFIYLGSKVSTDGRSSPEIARRIGLAAASMKSLERLWRQRHLRLRTKLRIYESCVLSVLLYCSETWTLLKTDAVRLQAFHMRCVRRIMGIWWYQHVTNDIVRERSQLEDIEPRIRRRRLSLFGHVARMKNGVPARDALETQINIRLGIAPSAEWGRPPGRPRTTWCSLIEHDLGGMDLKEAWTLAHDRVGWRRVAMGLCCP
jgi:hypothetical protein